MSVTVNMHLYVLTRCVYSCAWDMFVDHAAVVFLKHGIGFSPI